MLDLADVADEPACLKADAWFSDTYATVTMTVCESVRLEADGALTFQIGEESWIFDPEFLHDEARALPFAQAVEAAIEMRNLKDDLVHDIELTVWAEPSCP